MHWWRERWYPYFLMQLVIRRWTSCLSSSSNMAPKYPMRLSVNFWEAMSLRHSNCPKCAGYPSMCIYSSFATFLHLYVLSSSRKDDRIAAHSFWIISRSSAWVLAVRMVRISSRSLMGAGILRSDQSSLHLVSCFPQQQKPVEDWKRQVSMQTNTSVLLQTSTICSTRTTKAKRQCQGLQKIKIKKNLFLFWIQVNF